MKRTLIPILILALSSLASAQQSNPQNSWAATTTAARPSVWLPFNDSTAVFEDISSGLSFINATTPVYTSFPALTETVTGATSTGTTYVGNYSSGITEPGFLSSVVVCFATAPSAGQPLDIVITNTGSTVVQAIVPVTGIAAASGCQTLTSGTNYTGINIASGQQIGAYIASGVAVGHEATSGTNIYKSCSGAPTVGTGCSSAFYQYPIDIQANITTAFTSGTVTPRQQGFDNMAPGNTSAEFPYNGWNAAPNNTLGAVDWSSSYSMMVQIDRLNWDRSGALVLASKGDAGSCAGIITTCSSSGAWWQLLLLMHGANSQICFERSGAGSSAPTPGSSLSVQDGICTGGTFDAVPNGYNYNIIVTDSGTGGTGYSTDTTALSLYVNGLSVGSGFSNSYGVGFGYAALTIASAGSGFTATTAFTSTGGGANCVVAGTVTESGGALTAIAATQNRGCTSNPTIVLTAPTGTGGSISAVAQTASMNNATLPLLAPGFVSGGAYTGIDGTDSTQAPTYVDEFAEFPGVLTSTQIAALYYQTKFYQDVLYTVTPPPLVIYSNDGCGDTDNIFALNMLIRAHLLGQIKLIGVEDSITDGISQAFYRQTLDQAGLSNIPVAAPAGTVTGGNHCTTGDITAYSASTPQTATSYESSATMYRTAFAAYPSTPIFIAGGGPLDGIAQFLASSADSISSLTGEQLWAQDATNGGAVFLQGLGCCSTYSNLYYTYPAAQEVLANGNNGTMPIYFMGGTPQNGGPGALASRTSNDPLWLLDNTIGTDVRSCWDCLAGFAAMYGGLSADPFAGGVTIAYSGGTGYANATYGTLSGGGTNCQGSFIMTASSGVPNGITYTWGTTIAAYPGFGTGCVTSGSPPTVNLTAPTGTGVTLTATTTASACGTITQSTSTNGTTSLGACTNIYFVPYSFNAPSTPVSGALMTWLINSMHDIPPQGQPRIP